MTSDGPSFRYLNRDGRWRGFHWRGLQRDDHGVLRLLALPRFEGALPAEIASLPPAAPGGVAVDRDGAVYFSDPASARVYRVNSCSGETEAAPCLGGSGTEPTQFLQPAGLAIPRRRRVLYVADSGNGRIQLFDLDTMALGQILPGFQRPLSLASDDAGRLYVVDVDARRVDQVTVAGDVEPAFWEAVSPRVTSPRAVACEGEGIYVLDGDHGAVRVFDASGALVGQAETAVAGVAVFTVIAGAIYVADPGRRRIAVFRANQHGDFVRAGDAAGYEGPVAALGSDLRGALLVSPGGGRTPLRLTLEGSHASQGLLWSDAIEIDALPHFWNGLRAAVELGPGAHLQFFYSVAATPPSPPAPGSATPFDPHEWTCVPVDVIEFFVGKKRTPKLWVGALFTNDAHSTPALSQLRVDFDGESYLPFLPAIYRERPTVPPGQAEDDRADFLLRYVSLFESFFRDLEGKIDRLPVWLEPDAVPADALPWLAGFLALALPDTWDERRRREAVAGAYASYARRGTVAGLRDVLRDEAGVRTVIDEPIQAMGWWSLPAPSRSCRPDAPAWHDGADSILGFNTVLATAEPQGAVVGTTAALDRSQLLAADDYGSTLFETVAHQFTVQLYPGEVDCPGKLEQVTAIIEREKPAHTAFAICIITPGLRIGYRSRLGIDTLVGGGPVPSRLGDGPLVLAGQPRGRLGMRSHLGVNTQL